MSREDLFLRCSVCGGSLNLKDSKTAEGRSGSPRELLRLDRRVKEVAKKNHSPHRCSPRAVGTVVWAEALAPCR